MTHQFAATYVIVNLPDFTLRVMHDGKLVWTTKIVDRQAGNADADHDGGHEIHHHQSDLERAAVDHQSRISAGAGAGSDGARPHGLEGRRRIPTAPCISGSRPATRMRSAASASISPTNSWSISTTRRTNTCSPMTSGRSATAACGCRIRSIMPRCCCRWCGPATATPKTSIKKMIAAGSETDIQFPTFVPVNLTYQTAFVDDDGKLAIPRRHVWPRQGADRAPQERRPQSARCRRRASESTLRTARLWRCPTSRRCSAAIAYGGPNSYQGGGAGDGSNFFSRLFGGFASAPPPAPHKPATHARKLSRAHDTVER